jgi:Tol biopolymer transport system component
MAIPAFARTPAEGTAPRRAPVGDVARLALVWLLLASTLTGAAHAQDGSAPTRAAVVIGTSLPAAEAYANDFRGSNGGIDIDRKVRARIPGLPVRQHPVNEGLFESAGCAQCHRLAGPLPPGTDAPADIYDQLPAPRVETLAPRRFTRVTTTPTRDEYPIWSPDGRRLLYESRDRDGRYNLWLIDSDGTDPHQITDHHAAGWATWNPATDHIAYWASDAPASGDIWIHDLTTNTNHQLTHHALTAWPQWNPAGDWLAYQAKDRGRGWRLHLHNPVTGQHHALPDSNDTLPSRPLWNPDGTQILYQSFTDIGFQLRRLVFPTDEAGRPDYLATPERVAIPNVLPIDLGAGTGHAAWSPDGDRITFVTYVLDVIPIAGHVYTYKTWSTATNGNYPRPLVPDGTLGDRSASWSPDGAWLVQWSWNDDLSAGLWLVDADATRRLELTADLGGDALYPAWSPDGTRIAFAANREGTFDIWIADVRDVVDGTTVETRP